MSLTHAIVPAPAFERGEHTLRVGSPPSAAAEHRFALNLPESVHAILALAAAHDGVRPGDLVARLVCQHAKRIGLPGMLDELHAVPPFERAKVGRIRRE